jgi:hypothetical protein
MSTPAVALTSSTCVSIISPSFVLTGRDLDVQYDSYFTMFSCSASLRSLLSVIHVCNKASRCPGSRGVASAPAVLYCFAPARACSRMKEKDTFRRASPAIPRSRFASWKSRCKKLTARCPTGQKHLKGAASKSLFEWNPPPLIIRAFAAHCHRRTSPR